ncbi:MAG: hypothetical protein KKA32_12460 [Actinobacteria bacterium]|nr:hypothetical protein [Actinomycetota bacterium]
MTSLDESVIAQGDPDAAPAPHLTHEAGAAQDAVAAPAVDAAPVTDAAPAGGGGDELTWDFDIPLITDRFMLWEFFKVSGISALLVPILVGLMGFFVEGELVLLPWQVPVFAFAAMFVLFLLASLLLGNRHGATFHINADGVGYAARKRERRLNRLAIIVGVLGGSPTATGAGLLAASRETMFIPWEDVQRVKVYRGPRVIVLKDSWHVVQRLYCPPALFEQATRLVEVHHRAAADARLAEELALAKREAAEAAKRSDPLTASRAASSAARPVGGSLAHRLLLTAGGLILTVSAQAWYFNDGELAARAGIVGGVVIALSQLFREVAARQLFGFVGAIGVVWHAAMLGISAVEPIQGIYETTVSAVLDTEWLVVAAISTLALLGLALFPWIWKR